MQFEETYDEWSRLLRESGLVHPLWNQEDCEFVRNTLSSKRTTVELFLQETRREVHLRATGIQSF